MSTGGTFLGIWRLTGQGGAIASPILFAVIAEIFGYGSSFVFVRWRRWW